MKYTKLIKSEQSVSIPMSVYIDLLSNRFKEMGNHAGEEALALWPRFLDLIEETGPGDNTSPSYVVDNYLINGEFVSKNAWSNEYPTRYQEYQGNWQQFCENEAIIYDDNYACLNLGL